MEGGGPGDLGEGERQHRQIDAREPHAEPAEDHAGDAGEEGREGERRQHRHAQPLHRQRRAIGAEAEIGGVAEGGHAAGTHHEVQRGREQREDRELGQRQQPVIGDDEGRHQQHGERGEADQLDGVARRQQQRLDRTMRMGAADRALAHQAIGLDHEDDGHHQEDQHQRDLREDQDAEGVDDADQHGGEIGAGDAAEPADDHDDEGLRDHREVHVQVHRLARELQRAAERGEAGAEGEDRGEEQALVDAERADHLAVLRRGPHQRAPARLLEQEPEQAEHDRPDHDQEELIGREAAAHQHDKALEAGRARAELVLRPPDAERDVLHHQHQAESGEQLEQLRRLVDPAQDDDLHERAECRDDDSRQQPSEEPHGQTHAVVAPTEVTTKVFRRS